MSRLPLRPLLAPGFTVLAGPDRVRLVAGEDRRYTLSAGDLDTWLPAWMAGLDGRHTLDELLVLLPPEHREEARQLLAHLYGERVILDGPAAAGHRPTTGPLIIEGDGILADALRAGGRQSEGIPAVAVLTQDRLDYDEALRFNTRRLEGTGPWLWATCGPAGRGYVSPAFLPDAGPCLECLLSHFRRLSPAPELYEDLVEHARRGGAIAPSPFPKPGVGMLRELVLWKADLLSGPDPPAALYRLHVLEAASLEVTAHRVFVDPECPACSGRR
jgi:bacteriocin biosynthesis cyclodehydratase domain-containing protein